MAVVTKESPHGTFQHKLRASNYSKDNVSVASSKTVSTEISCARTGYTNLGIIGVTVAKAGSSGKNQEYCMITDFGISGDTVTIGVRNIGSSAAKIKITVRVLQTVT